MTKPGVVTLLGQIGLLQEQNTVYPFHDKGTIGNYLDQKPPLFI